MVMNASGGHEEGVEPSKLPYPESNGLMDEQFRPIQTPLVLSSHNPLRGLSPPGGKYPGFTLKRAIHGNRS